MSDPETSALLGRIEGARARASSINWQYADGPAYYEGRAAHEAARHDLARAERELADLTGQLKSLRQKIGIARRQLGIAPESHAAVVARHTGGRATSTTDCSRAELEAILAELRAKGATPRPPRKAGRAPAEAKQEAQPLLKKIGALLADQRLPWSYAEAILRRQRGITSAVVSTPIEHAHAGELRAVVTALAKRQAKHRREDTPT